MDWGGLLCAIGKFLGKNLVENASKEVIKHFPLTKSTIPAKKQYISACLKINNLLYENKKLFVENCPFLDLESDGIVEVDNWYQIQKRMLNPNNLKILYLIEDIENIIPENKKEIFLKILLFGTKILNRQTNEIGLLIKTWKNEFADRSIWFATCVDTKGKLIT